MLVTGETGTGKEVVARLIHDRSARTAGGLVTIACAGLPDALLESELFGHVRGSFTGAYRDKPGLLETVPHGSVFLDEVAEMSPRMQAVLLRFLESGELQRIGRERAHSIVKPRLIAATNRDLPAAIAAGAFREDLYFRLNVLHVRVPPLRDRPQDVALFAARFLSLVARRQRRTAPAMDPDALAALEAYRWPGNVRELRNVIERLALRSAETRITLADLPAEVRAAAPPVRVAEAAGDPLPGPADFVAQMIERGESFWSTVYPAFMARDLTRRDLRTIIRAGLEATRGNYRTLVERFNMSSDDYRRFLAFLRQHDCHLSMQIVRTSPVNGAEFDRSPPSIGTDGRPAV